ncbi:hypothetical protein T492DRAFT_84460, partial [Pavlovales sp. CCMP2436]
MASVDFEAKRSSEREEVGEGEVGDTTDDDEGNLNSEGEGEGEGESEGEEEEEEGEGEGGEYSGKGETSCEEEGEGEEEAWHAAASAPALSPPFSAARQSARAESAHDDVSGGRGRARRGRDGGLSASRRQVAASSSANLFAGYALNFDVPEIGVDPTSKQHEQSQGQAQGQAPPSGRTNALDALDASLRRARAHATSSTLALADDMNGLWEVTRTLVQAAIDRA